MAAALPDRIQYIAILSFPCMLLLNLVFLLAFVFFVVVEARWSCRYPLM